MPSTLGTVPGVQDGIPLFRSYGWHTYNWANYGPVYVAAATNVPTVDQITGTTVRITFTPTFTGSARIEYGLGRGAAQRTPVFACTAGTPVSVTLSQLAPSMQYTYLIAQYATSTDQTGQVLAQTIYGDQYEFATAGGSQVAPVISLVQVSTSGGVGNRIATITWLTDVPCLNKVNYGATVSYGTTRSDTTTPPSQRGATVTTTKLVAGNTYHYQCASQGRDYAHGLIATTVDNTFVA
jgi:hypothetical protein